MPFDPQIFIDSSGRYHQIDIRDLSSRQVDEWKQNGIVLLIGSYISTFAPTNLPAGGECVKTLWNTIFSKKQNGSWWPEWLHSNFEKLPFEVVMQNCPDKEGITESIQRTFGTAQPNPIHELLAEQVNQGAVHTIITTNFDLCFDTALHNNEICTIWDEQSQKESEHILSTSGRAYWKIHGSAHPGALKSLAFDPEAERQMEPWKQTLLKNLLQDKTLVILGYSGSDFDICPELASTVRPKHVVWLQRDIKGVTLNAKRVLAQQKSTLVLGDFDHFLTALFGTHTTPVAGTGRFELSINPKSILQWRVQVLNAMGCGELMLEDIPGLSESRSTTELHSAAYANIGKYRDAVTQRKLQLSDPGLDQQSRLQLRLDIASSRFIYGSHIPAWREVTRVEHEIRNAGISDLRTNLGEVKLMMAMRLGQIAERTRTEFLFSRLRKNLRKMYVETRDVLAQKGQWGRLHGLRLTAQRLGIVSPNEEGELTLPALASYLSVGYMAMVSVSVRDEVRSKGPWRLCPEKKDASLWAIRMARRYHWKHEEWKFRWLLLLRGGGRFRLRHFNAWSRVFWSTQYTFTGRIMQILFNSTYRSR